MAGRGRGRRTVARTESGQRGAGIAFVETDAETGAAPTTRLNRTTPALYTSLRASTGFAVACSGDMKNGVPMIVPSLVGNCTSPRRLVERTLAMPKSSTFTTRRPLASGAQTNTL